MPTKQDFRRILLIGLGGSGQRVLLHLKRQFLDIYGVVPPSVRFLCLDTDVSRLSLRSQVRDEEYRLSAAEFIHMEVRNPATFIEEDPVVNDWFIRPVPMGALERGAGQVRQNGRLAFFYHLNTFNKRVASILTELRDATLAEQMGRAGFSLSRQHEQVFVCGSLAGGTGSGCFLDVGILLRDMCPNALIMGFFLLDWVYRGKPWAFRVEGNTYAALAELDNLESIMFASKGAREFTPYRMTYGKRTIEVAKAPYDLVNLIDGRNTNGDVFSEVEQLCEMVGSAIFLSVTDMGAATDSAVDNLLTHVTTPDFRVWGKRYARYSSFGVSSIWYPAQQLHRFAAYQAARTLCEKALSEASDRGESAPATAGAAAVSAVNSFLIGLGLADRDSVRSSAGAAPMPQAFQASDPEINDRQFPALFRQALEQARTNLTASCGRHFTKKAAPWLAQVTGRVEAKLSELEKDPAASAAWRREWSNAAVQRFDGWRDEVAKLLAECATDLANKEGDLNTKLKAAAQASTGLPLWTNPRKKAAQALGITIQEWLDLIRKKQELEFEKQVYETLIETLRKGMPAAVPRGATIRELLSNTRTALGRRYEAEFKNFQRIRAMRPNEIVPGDGVLVVDEVDTTGVDSFDVSYAEFKAENKIGTPEDYLSLAEGEGATARVEPSAKLAELIHQWCLTKLARLSKHGVIKAMEIIGQKEGQKKYFARMIDRMFELAAPLWSFDRSQLTVLQALRYDQVTNIGVPESEDGKRLLDEYVQEARHNYRISADYNYTSTGDPYRISILAYAGALPACLLTDLKEMKREYEEGMMPTYHIDPVLEREVPDLFPVDERANRALRVLAMAIVPEIGVVRDEYHPDGKRGHRFTLDSAEVRQYSHGEPLVWRLFRDMYREVQDSDGQFDILECVTGLLRQRVPCIAHPALRAAIEAQIKRFEKRVCSRDFSRLVSARLTYREMKRLKEFLDPKGYDMDLERYIEGQL